MCTISRNKFKRHYYPFYCLKRLKCIWVPNTADLLSWKKSALVWSEILRLFVNTLTADNKYSRCNVHDAIISKTKDFFSILNVPKWQNLEHFEKKDEYPSLIISEIKDCERGSY